MLTLNTRTEVIWAATAREAAEEGRRRARECTSFALAGRRTRAGRPLTGQNWDWLTHCRDTLVILEVEQPDAPNYVTVVEAGLLAKCSLNSAGLAVMTNALVTSADRGEPGIPYHVMLRALADCEQLSSAIDTIQKNFRASAANYLLSTGDDVAVDLEAGPGDFLAVQAILPEDGALVHTNHFLRSPRRQDDVSLYAMPDSLIRLQRAEQAIARSAEPHDIAFPAAGSERSRRLSLGRVLSPATRGRGAVGDCDVGDHGPAGPPDVDRTRAPVRDRVHGTGLRQPVDRGIEPGQVPTGVVNGGLQQGSFEA